MSCGKCGCGKGKGLCPISFGLALGITGGLAVLIWSVWIMYHGMSPMMIERHLPMPTWSSSSMHAVWALLKGFFFGFFLAVFYDLFICCKSMCRKKSGPCVCGCSCCSPGNKTEAEKRISL